VAPGDHAFVRLRLESTAVLARGDRYILRAYSPPVTIAGGLILDPRPPRGAIRSAAALARCQRLAFDPAVDDRAEADQRAAAVMIEDAGRAGLSVTALTTRVGVDPGDVAVRADALVAAQLAIRAGDVLVAAHVFQRVKERVTATLAASSIASALQVCPRGAPASSSGAAPRRVFERASPISAAQERRRPRSHRAGDRIAWRCRRKRSACAPRSAAPYRDGRLKPPDAASIAVTTGVPAAVADRMLKLLQRQKVLVRVDVLLFHDEALKQLKAEVTAMKAAAGATARIDVATFKERFGVTRKFAIPLLEYLDRERLTKRVGDSRVML
jgi:selenocysteine-specific elongation factor